MRLLVPKATYATGRVGEADAIPHCIPLQPCENSFNRFTRCVTQVAVCVHVHALAGVWIWAFETLASRSEANFDELTVLAFKLGEGADNIQKEAMTFPDTVRMISTFEDRPFESPRVWVFWVAFPRRRSVALGVGRISERR